jgi:hypothetical protein
MLFSNNRIRNTHISTVPLHGPTYRHKLGYSYIISGCLFIIAGLIFIVTSAIYETRKTAFTGIGIISLGVGFFLMTLFCFHGELNNFYNTWTYRSHLFPFHLATPQPAPAGIIAIPPFVGTTTMTSTTPLSPPTPLIMGTDIEMGKIVIAPTIEIGKTIVQSSPDKLA